MMHWDDLRIILAVCREGSLAGAARVLGSNHSTVFRQVNAIEKKLSTRFFNRLSHGYEMTESGELLLKRAVLIEEDIADIERSLQGKDLRLKGTIRLSAPEGISHYLLMPHLASFYRKHPDIMIDLVISSQDMEFSRHETDIAIRTTKNPPPNCIGKKVCDFNIAIYATKAYLEKVKTLKFQQYEYLQINNGVNWFPPPHWTSQSPPKIIFKSDSIFSVARAASEGIGAAVLPCLIGNKESKLKCAATPYKSVAELWILTHADLRQTARVKALMDHLYECLSKEKKYIEG